MSIDALINRDNGEKICQPTLSNEWVRLAQGNDAGVKHMDTITFIPKNDVPMENKVMYASFVCNHRPLKDEKWRIRLVVGGDQLEYYSDPGSPATDLTETKILLNSVISDAKHGARFASMNLKDMFLHTTIENPEYTKVPYK